MTSEQVKIRRPVPDDKEAWLVRWQGYLTFYKTTLPDDWTERLWQRLLDDDDPIQGRVAERDGQVVGLVHFFPQPNTWFGTTCYLNDVFVDPDLRGGGIGRALIDAVADEARGPRLPPRVLAHPAFQRAGPQAVRQHDRRGQRLCGL